VLGAVADPRAAPALVHHYGHIRRGRRADLGNRFFRSMWEANWARYLCFLVAHGAIRSWSYEPRRFEFVSIRYGTRSYTPDFEIVELNGAIIYEEVKGRLTSKSAVQLKRMARYYPDVKIRLIGPKEYYAVAARVSALIPGWERQRS
jgi:Protein of unknown function (DUF1064)